eukprot:839975-Prymnesium_polylepis.1
MRFLGCAPPRDRDIQRITRDALLRCDRDNFLYHNNKEWGCVPVLASGTGYAAVSGRAFTADRTLVSCKRYCTLTPNGHANDVSHVLTPVAVCKTPFTSTWRTC